MDKSKANVIKLTKTTVEKLTKPAAGEHIIGIAIYQVLAYGYFQRVQWRIL